MTFHNRVCQSGVKLNQLETSHHSDIKAAQKRYDSDIKKMVQMFDGRFIDPFDLIDPATHLTNFATGVISSSSVQDSLLDALDKGSEMAHSFMKERFIKLGGQNKPQKSFYDPLPKANIKTMADMQKTVKVKAKNVVMNGEVMYLRLLAVNSFKKVPLERVLSFENAPVPLSIINDDGSMTTCVKSDFMHKLEGMYEDKVTSIGSTDCIIFDAMAVIQMLPVPSKTVRETFVDMVEQFCDYILRNSRIYTSVSQIHIVFDRYEENSLKSLTRQKRGDSTKGHKIHIQADMTVPKEWKKFLSRGENKENLAAYYTNFIIETVGSQLERNETIFISGGLKDRAIYLNKDEHMDISELKCNQEEADTRIVLHASYAANHGANRIVVKSPDTEVLVLLLHHRSNIIAKKIFFHTGRMGTHVDMKRNIPVHVLFNCLTEEQRAILTTVYCLTGCDTCSAFYGIGKKSVFKLLIQRAPKFQGLKDLGNGPLLKSQKITCTQFVGALYGKPDCTSLNEIRCAKAAKKVPPKRLPPTDNSFHLHLLRCTYQLMVWKSCLEISHVLPPPTDYGYETIDDNDGTQIMRPLMMNQSPAAPELLNDLTCNCENSICDDSCTCFRNEQPCTLACKCKAAVPWDSQNENRLCTNIYTLSMQSTSDSESDSD